MSGPSPEHRAFVEAGIGVVMGVIMADGNYTQDEFALFAKAQYQYALFKDVPAEAFNGMLNRVKARLSAEPWKALMSEYAAAVPADHRVEIYKLACQFATIDKDVGGKEPEVITHLAKSFGIPDEDARKMFMDRIVGM